MVASSVRLMVLFVSSGKRASLGAVFYWCLNRGRQSQSKDPAKLAEAAPTKESARGAPEERGRIPPWGERFPPPRTAASFKVPLNPGADRSARNDIPEPWQPEAVSVHAD